MDRATIDRIKESTDIVGLVSQSRELRRAGRGYVCQCLWHDDRKPSLTIDPVRQTWKCWVCDIGGDVFSWTMRRDGVGFIDAAKILAQDAGIRIDDDQKQDDRRKVIDVLNAVAEAYHQGLNAESRAYLHGRGIDDSSIHKFKLGSWVPSDRLGIPVADLIDAGVVGVTDSKRQYDRFMDRIVIPIRDPQGKVIALGGRVFKATQFTKHMPKYLNSPETVTFKKSKVLFGLDVAMDAIRKQKTAIVTEGYTDSIMAHQRGVRNVVACLGTALSHDHLSRLATIGAHDIVLMLDGDDAGRKRMLGVVDLLTRYPGKVSIAVLPSGKDPDDFFRSGGAVSDLHLQDPIVFKVESMVTGSTEPKTVASEIREVAKFLASLPEEDRYAAAGKAAQIIGCDIELFKARPARYVEAVRQEKRQTVSMHVMVVLAIVWRHPELLGKCNFDSAAMGDLADAFSSMLDCWREEIPIQTLLTPVDVERCQSFSEQFSFSHAEAESAIDGAIQELLESLGKS